MADQDLLECPYDKHHRILKHRMQVHLIKCRRNHPNEQKVTCPFNTTHILNKQELEFHVQECTERRTFESLINADTPVTKPTIPPPMPKAESDENWNDENAPTYNPMAYVTKAPVLRNLRGAQPAERKIFRKQERLRLLDKQD